MAEQLYWIILDCKDGPNQVAKDHKHTTKPKVNLIK